MRIPMKTILAAVGALVFCAAPAMANAERVYFLVGMRHVYRIGTDMYAHVSERERIEQDYADQVAADNDEYNKAIASGADATKETADLNNALDDLATERDQKLGAIYELADFERDRHPELRIDADGPYQVVGVNFHRHADIEVFDNYVVYAPWPGYVVVDPPYGWAYGVVYSPFAFLDIYLGWHSHWFGLGCPAFVGFYGHFGPVFVGGFSRGPGGRLERGLGGGQGRGGLGRVLGNGGSRYSRTASGTGYTRSTSRYNSGSFGAGRTTTRYNSGGTGSRYGRTGSTSRYNSGSFGASRSTSRYNSGGYRGRSSSSRYNSGGYSSGRSTSRYTSGRSTSGYSSGRSSGGYSRSGAGYNSGRSSSGSSYGRSSGGGYSHSNSSFGSGRSSSGFSGGRSSSGSFGGGRGSSSGGSTSRGSSHSGGSSRKSGRA